MLLHCTEPFIITHPSFRYDLNNVERGFSFCVGLEGGFTEEKQVFTVDVKGAGQGGLALAIDGPAETPINCKDNRDGTCEVEYQPVKPGDYDVTIKFADQPIQGNLSF